LKLIRRNLGLKIVSLVLAYVAWAYVVSRSPGVRFVNAPVEITAPEGLAVVDYEPREVRVKLEGDAPVIKRISEQSVYVRVQLEGTLRAGSQRVAVLERNVQGAPPGTTKEVLTPLLNVTLQRRVTRNVPVRVRVSGLPPSGYRVTEARAEPPLVEISGPEDALRAVDQIWTEPIDPRKHQRPFTVRASLVKPDPLASVRPNDVEVNLLVDEVPAPLELLLPVLSRVEGAETDPPRVRVVIEGPPSVLTQVGENLTAFVTGDSGVRSGTVPVRLDYGSLPDSVQSRIRIVLLDPGRVHLRRTR
jgi:YbbR domain-containing protein